MTIATSTPPVRLVRRSDLHRLVPSKYSQDGASELARIADGEAHLADLFDLDLATNERVRAENGLNQAIGPQELVFGVPFCRIVNAAFSHPHPMGSRFNGPERGAWYCALQLHTAQAEVVFHRTLQLAEVNRFDDVASFDDYQCDVSASLHDLRTDGDLKRVLDPDSYVASQGLAARLLADGALGLVYPSVRRPGGTCVVCFRPALVVNVRKSHTYQFRWEGKPQPRVDKLN